MEFWKNNNIEGNEIRANMKKSKLVTICCTPSSNDEFGNLYPNFKYHGQSRSEKKVIDVNFPSYPKNLMYYEHYDSLTSPSTRLSFIYVGGDENGEVCHDFYDYKHVQTVDFSDQLTSVKAVFQIIGQLQNCSEVRIFLNQTNIGLSETDYRFPPHLVKNYSGSFRNANVKSLRVEGCGSVTSKMGTEIQSRTRLHDVLKYALVCFPKLEAVRICMENSGGTYYDAVQDFCSNKLNLPKHCVHLKNGKVTCDPELYPNLMPNKSPVSASAVASSSALPRATAVSANYVTVTSRTPETVKTPEKIDSCTHLKIIKTEEARAQVLIKNEDKFAVIDLASDPDDEEPCSPPKKKRFQEESPKSSSSTNSRASTVIVTGSPNKLQNCGIGKGSSYDEWEDDDESSVPLPKAPLLPTPKTAPLLQVDGPLLPPTIPPFSLLPIHKRSIEARPGDSASTPKLSSFLDQIQFDQTQIQNILNTVQASSSAVEPSNKHPTQTPIYKRSLKEGVDFERRPKPGNSGQKSRNIKQTS